MALVLYNTRTRREETFVPLVAGRISMYVCGITVYDYCHLGHARMMIAFDVVQRWLRASGFRVTYVRNITDIDDKIIRRAAENREPVEALTARFIEAMHEDLQIPNYGEPGRGPRLAEGMVLAIEPMVNMGRAAVRILSDGWTAVTRDGSLSAHFEHTVAVTRDGPLVLTDRTALLRAL